jgi:3-oxoacyl-[acyl-carrier protein] reductase
MTQRLAGKVALVTGAARGIGAAVARRLATDGAKVVINYVNSADAARDVVRDITAAGGEAYAAQADIAQIVTHGPLVDAAIKHFGRLDILVNNAAIAEAGLLDQIDEAFFDRHVATNMKATLFLSQAFARAFQGEGGAIINVSSIGTRAGAPNFMVYSATKAAIEMLTVTMSRDLGRKGIRVNAVAPGQIDSDMLRKNIPAKVLSANVARISLGRLGLPTDIAPVVSFLASADAGWITGETIHVSGGQRL